MRRKLSPRCGSSSAPVLIYQMRLPNPVIGRMEIVLWVGPRLPIAWSKLLDAQILCGRYSLVSIKRAIHLVSPHISCFRSTTPLGRRNDRYITRVSSISKPLTVAPSGTLSIRVRSPICSYWRGTVHCVGSRLWALKQFELSPTVAWTVDTISYNILLHKPTARWRER